MKNTQTSSYNIKVFVRFFKDLSMNVYGTFSGCLKSSNFAEILFFLKFGTKRGGGAVMLSIKISEEKYPIGVAHIWEIVSK